MCVHITYIYILYSICNMHHMLSGPGLPQPPPPSPPWYPRPPALGPPSSPAQPERTHANQRERGRWSMIPASSSSQSGEPHQSRDRGTACKETRATSNFLVWQRDVAGSDDISANKRLQPYLCGTHCPPQAGRGQPKRPQAPPYRGGGDKAKQDHPKRRGKQQGQTRD